MIENDKQQASDNDQRRDEDGRMIGTAIIMIRGLIYYFLSEQYYKYIQF